MAVADIEMAMAQYPSAADPPNLRGTMLARPDPQRAIDLKDLDRFHSTPEKEDS